MAGVSVRGLTLRFGTATALADLSLDFPDGEFFGLLGPSGSGKTTLLRIIAGFLFPTAGEVRIGGEPVERVPVEKREIGMVFQNYALFPNMSVADNIAFGLKVRKLADAEIARRVGEVIELVQLQGLGNRRPHQLSGGQRQRVALARAIVTRPRVLLLDEPLSALDKALRVGMQIELKRIQREVGITTIFVTHDQEEALTLSDRIGILRDGRLVQEGPPRDVYRAPIDRFAATFLGDANIFEGVPCADGLRLASGDILKWPGAPGRLAAVRPEAIAISVAPPGRTGANAIKAELSGVVFTGPTAVCLIKANGQDLKALVKAGELKDISQVGPIWISWPIEETVAIGE